MLTTLATTDAVTWITILVKALAYGATLLAAGSVLVASTLTHLSAEGRRVLGLQAIAFALVAAMASAAALPLRASFLMGGTWAGSFDPGLLAIVMDSPLGTSLVTRLLGLSLILAALLGTRTGRGVALVGAVLACASFALKGHTLGDPRWVLAGLITVHMLGLAFWVGAFAPLTRAARVGSVADAGHLAHEFGAKALWIVGALIVAGAALLATLGVASPQALGTPYGQTFALKLAFFVGVIGLAAFNKLRLTPALLAGDISAPDRLRRSIRVEAALVVAVLLTTATLTTVTSPQAPETTARVTLERTVA
ncbi:MAG: CopD family protein [Pseudomonadota bacterium]